MRPLTMKTALCPTLPVISTPSCPETVGLGKPGIFAKGIDKASRKISATGPRLEPSTMAICGRFLPIFRFRKEAASLTRYIPLRTDAQDRRMRAKARLSEKCGAVHPLRRKGEWSYRRCQTPGVSDDSRRRV